MPFAAAPLHASDHLRTRIWTSGSTTMKNKYTTKKNFSKLVRRLVVCLAYTKQNGKKWPSICSLSSDRSFWLNSTTKHCLLKLQVQFRCYVSNLFQLENWRKNIQNFFGLRYRHMEEYKRKTSYFVLIWFASGWN